MLLLLTTAMAQMGPQATLVLDFDDPNDPWRDDATVPHTLTSTTFTEDGLTGTGVVLDATVVSPGGGYAAYFDGGSALEWLTNGDDVYNDLTVQMWFRTPGIERSGFTRYAERMHLCGFFRQQGSNFDVDLDDQDADTGLWVYWNGGGTPRTIAPGGTMGTWTDDAWYQLTFVREGGVASMFIEDTAGSLTQIDSTVNSDVIGVEGITSALGMTATSGYTFGYTGWMDAVHVWPGALYPSEGADWCPAEGDQPDDTDGDFIGDDCDVCPEVSDPLQADVDSDGLGDACDPCEDHDGDGYGAGECDEDCDDSDPDIYPNAPGLDEDCDEVVAEDTQQDTEPHDDTQVDTEIEDPIGDSDGDSAVDSGTPVTPKGECGCASGPAPSLAWGLLLLAALRRRQGSPYGSSRTLTP